MACLRSFGCIVAVLLAGCTFEAGGPFATLSASLRAGYVVPADRDAGDGWQRLSSDYQVRVTTVRLQLDDIQLLAAGEGAASFDPSNPPAGYSLCHNGHCHSSDGRLVPYADIEAELAGASGGQTTPAVSLVVGEALDLTGPAERAADLPARLRAGAHPDRAGAGPRAAAGAGRHRPRRPGPVPACLPSCGFDSSWLAAGMPVRPGRRWPPPSTCPPIGSTIRPCRCSWPSSWDRRCSTGSTSRG